MSVEFGHTTNYLLLSAQRKFVPRHYILRHARSTQAGQRGCNKNQNPPPSIDKRLHAAWLGQKMHFLILKSENSSEVRKLPAQNMKLG